MRHRLVSFDALTTRELDAWHGFLAANSALDSPCYHPGFAASVHAGGRPVRVLVSEEDGVVRALLPVQLDGGLARPAGWPAADFQGPVLAPGTRFEPRALLGAGLRGYAFDHLPAGYGEFAPWVAHSRPSPFLDVSGGLDGYLGRVSRSGKDKMGEARRLTAKIEREHGPVRFTADSRDPAALDRVIELKRTQYAATGARDYFADPARADWLHRLLRTTDPAFGGLLCTVHIGPKLVAAHFGMRASHVLHWWFPVYDKEFARLSPGWILLREVIRAAPGLGLERIDLGRGEDDYKRRAMTGQVMVGEGLVAGGVRRALHGASRSAVAAVKASPLAPKLRAVARRLRS
ncbi:GNAT family N-acetyltransferase [Amycolatopsis anabasis]|uniref:GNAT family N-acetyltransferase n=1 Tax=Amycolatopsis anabasis TaxID=1840409 RepID=UPI00131B96B3|nr:GNAT family N-acetyltransferase [Amycolatopsis anabasis]